MANENTIDTIPLEFYINYDYLPVIQQARILQLIEVTYRTITGISFGYPGSRY